MFIQPQHRRSVRCPLSKKAPRLLKAKLSQSLFVRGARAALTFARIHCMAKCSEHIAALTQESSGSRRAGDVDAGKPPVLSAFDISHQPSEPDAPPPPLIYTVQY